ncbi:MAG: hypothetical protein QXZ17_12425 [Nitrososphaerota archaeon]
MNIKLVMFGCKGSWVEKYARKLGVKRSIIFVGRESFARLYEIISTASAVVMPGIRSEPFGRIPLIVSPAVIRWLSLDDVEDTLGVELRTCHGLYFPLLQSLS